MPGTSVFGLIALVMSVILLYQISHLSGMKKTETESAKAAGETEGGKKQLEGILQADAGDHFPVRPVCGL